MRVLLIFYKHMHINFFLNVQDNSQNLVLISDSWQLFAATKKGSITKSVPPCQWREPGGDAEQLPVMTYIMALHPISVETGTGRKANGAGS